MSQKHKIEFLEKYQFAMGPRDYRLNTKFPGAFMVVEPFDENELPTEDGSNGPWCVVGDDLNFLIDRSYEFWESMIEPSLEPTQKSETFKKISHFVLNNF